MSKIFYANNCDGSGPHWGTGEVRVYPLGAGGNLILCRACFDRENRFRLERGREMGRPEDWPHVEYQTSEVYKVAE